MDLKSYFMNKYGGRAGEKREKKRRGYAKEEASTLAKSRMAEIEREQQGQTRRTRMEQAGLMEREKLGQAGAGGFTSPQMANLRKSAYDAANKEIERRRGLMPGEPGAFFMGKGKNQIPFTDEQIAMARESIADKYLQGYIGPQQVQPEEPQGYGTLSTAGGRTFDVLGNKVTERPINQTVSALTGTQPSGQLTTYGVTEKQPTTYGAPGMQWDEAFQEAGKEFSGAAKYIKEAWKKRKKPRPIYQPF